jgi:hypothetical protein
MFSEYLGPGHRNRLGAVANAKFGVQMAKLRLHGVLTDVEMTAKLAVRHSGREQRQELALAFGEANIASWPAHLFIDLRVLGSLRQDDALSVCGSPDAVDDLVPWHGLGDESLRARTKGSSHRLGPVGEAEDNDGAVFGVGTERADSLVERFGFSVGVEKRDIDTPSGLLPYVEFDDPDLRIARFEEGAEALEDDHVVVDERNPN